MTLKMPHSRSISLRQWNCHINGWIRKTFKIRQKSSLKVKIFDVEQRLKSVFLYSYLCSLVCYKSECQPQPSLIQKQSKVDSKWAILPGLALVSVHLRTFSRPALVTFNLVVVFIVILWIPEVIDKVGWMHTAAVFNRNQVVSPAQI